MANERLSISVPADLAAWAREHAKTTGTSISAVVADALRRMVIAETRHSMLTGLLSERYADAAPVEIDALARAVEDDLGRPPVIAFLDHLIAMRP